MQFVYMVRNNMWTRMDIRRCKSSRFIMASRDGYHTPNSQETLNILSPSKASESALAAAVVFSIRALSNCRCRASPGPTVFYA